MGDVTRFTDLATSLYRHKPRFKAMLEATAQPMADNIELEGLVPGKFDLDTAEGEQLDVVGRWIGASRNLAIPITGVQFSFDTPGLGFDEGVWDAGAGGGDIVMLSDEDYRILLRARVLNNHWDGTIENAYEIWDQVFADTGYTLFIVDHGDLSMTLGLLFDGDTISATVLALFTGGYLNVKPAGVRIRDYIAASARPPIFALDEEGASFAGLDEGSWAESLVGP